MADPTRAQPFAALLVLAAATAATAFVGGLASAGSVTFYRELAQPAWAPPPSVFGPVWTLLYVLMTVAAWLVIRELGWPQARPAILLYLAQLALNALWTWLFFRWRRGLLSLIEILLLWLLILVMTAVFWRARPLAGVLLLPYLGWVGFATALTFALWRRNPELLGGGV